MDTVLLPAAAASMDLVWVNKDLLTEILPRLPAKSLIRFKSVCKEWLSLISSDDFCHQHTLRCPKLQQSLLIEMNPLRFFYFNQTTDGEKVMIPYSLSIPDHRVLQGCNGLLLLEFNPPKNSSGSRRREYSYSVYNPTTRRSRKITPTKNDKLPYVAAIDLAFDPSKSPYYKIVCVRCGTRVYLRPYTYHVEVYDSESHTWKLSLEPFIYPGRLNTSGDGVYWNNSIYWRASYGFYDHYARLDIAKIEMNTLGFPQDDRGQQISLQESNGRLYHFDWNDHRGIVAVRELGGDDNSRWLLKHRGKIHYDCDNVDVIPVRFMGGSDGDEACSLVVYEFKRETEAEPEPGKMMAYNFLDKSYELLVDFTGQPDVMRYYDDDFVRSYNFMSGCQFGESMALV